MMEFDWWMLLISIFHSRFWSAVGRRVIVAGNGRWQREWSGQQRWDADSGRHRLGGGRRSRPGADVRHYLLFQVGATDACEERGCDRRCSNPSSTPSPSPARDQGSQFDCPLFAPWRRSSAAAHAAAPAAGFGTDASSIPAAAAQLHAIFSKFFLVITTYILYARKK